MVRRSKRLIEYNNQRFNETTDKIINLIGETAIEINNLERVLILIKIYELVIHDFRIIIDSNSYSLYNFIHSMKEKSLEIINFINETKNTIDKKIYNKISKTLNLFDKKHEEFIDIQLQKMNVLRHTKTLIEEGKEECPICMEIIQKNKGITTHCKHNFHKICLMTHIHTNNNCPMCRSLIKSVCTSESFYINNERIRNQT